jgi:hypothetical protein
MKKRIIIFYNEGSLDVKVKYLYEENRFCNAAKNFLNNIDEDKNWDINKSPIFIGGNCNISRFKVREHCKITYNLNNSEALFFATDSGDFKINSFVNSNFYQKTKYRLLDEASYMFAELLLLSSNKKVTKNIKKILNFKKLYNDTTQWLLEEDVVPELKELFVQELNTEYRDLPRNLKHHYYVKHYYYYSDKLGYDFLNKDIRDKKLGHKDIYSLHHLKKHIHGDALAITSDSYNELTKMLGSGQKDNQILAMEIIANSKFDESFHYLFMLVLTYSGTMADHAEYDHVNFKSFRQNFIKLGRDVDAFYLTSNWMGWNLDFAAKNLIKMNQFTQEKMDLIINHLSPKTILNSEYFNAEITYGDKLIEDYEQ